MNEFIFSHRPLAGVSVGAFSENGMLYVAFSLVNDGTSRNAILHPERRDTFSRPIARNIIRGRIETMREPSQNFVSNGSGALVEQPSTTDFGVVFETPMSARQFISRFRETFKPDAEENDDFLISTGDFAGVEVRYRPTADEILDRIMNLANEVVANASASV